VRVMNGKKPRAATAPRVAAPRPRGARNGALGRAKATGGAGRILIVEDDFLVASAMEDALRDAGLQVAGIAASADEALALAAAEKPALAVMDVRLRGGRDGIDAALELFARHGVRVVFATAHQTPDARARAAPANPLAWVPKPYASATLVDIVRRAVRDVSSAK